MLDENLPSMTFQSIYIAESRLHGEAFYLKSSTDNVKHDTTIYLSQSGLDAVPTYTLRHPDPALPASKNRYAAAIYDSYNPEVLFGEVLLIPEWSQPAQSKEEIRQNGGIPPPPQPLLPSEFTIQLYNPDQQILVRQHAGAWNFAPYWDFEMPQQTFRQPSTSTLDRTKSDPTASDTTPKINFKWKRDGKLSKDLSCNLSGKSTNPDGSKRKHREPDIAIAFFHHLREITIYEPNLYRVEMEDPKGLEVVLLLSAVVIKEIYFRQMREAFNITESSKANSNHLTSRDSSQTITTGSSQHNVPSSQKPPNSRPPLRIQTSNPRPPPTDRRSQWEIDAETARLKKQVLQEEHRRRRAEQAETKRIQQMLEAEEKEAKRKQVEIDKETERLRKEYLIEQRRLEQRKNKPALPPRHSIPEGNIAPPIQYPFSNQQQGYFQQLNHSGRYLQPPGAYENASSSGFFHGSELNPDSNKKVRGKTSFFGLRNRSEDQTQRLSRKQSSVF